MIKGPVREQTHFKSISPDRISFPRKIPCWTFIEFKAAMQQLKTCVFLRAMCVHSPRSPITYIFDNEDITYVSGGGRVKKMWISNDWTAFFTPDLGIASLHFARGRESCIHLVCLIGHGLWKGSPSGKKRDVAPFFFSQNPRGKYASRLNRGAPSPWQFTLLSSPHYHRNLVIWPFFLCVFFFKAITRRDTLRVILI